MRGAARSRSTRSTPIAFADMRPGCYDPTARLADMDVNRTERSLCFPYVPRFAGQMFLEAKDKDLALRVRARLQRLDDRRVVRRPRRSAHPAVPRPAVGSVAGRGRGAAQRRARLPRHHVHRAAAANLGLPSIHDPSRYWDPFFEACDETGTVVCMHIGSGSKMADVSPTRPRASSTALTFSMAQHVDGRLAAVGRARALPEPEDRVLREPDRLDAVPPRAARQGVRRSAGVAELDPIITELPSTLRARPRVRLLLRRHDRHRRPPPDRHRASSCSRSTTRTRTRPGPHTPKLVEQMATRVTPTSRAARRIDAHQRARPMLGPARVELDREPTTSSSATAPSSTAPASTPTAPTSASIGDRIATIGRIRERGVERHRRRGPRRHARASSTATRTWTRRCSGIRSAPTRAGTASRRW